MCTKPKLNYFFLLYTQHSLCSLFLRLFLITITPSIEISYPCAFHYSKFIIFLQFQISKFFCIFLPKKLPKNHWHLYFSKNTSCQTKQLQKKIVTVCTTPKKIISSILPNHLQKQYLHYLSLSIFLFLWTVHYHTQQFTHPTVNFSFFYIPSHSNQLLLHFAYLIFYFYATLHLITCLHIPSLSLFLSLCLKA